MSKRAREEPPTNSSLVKSKNTKKARQMNFAAVTAEDLEKLGVIRKRLAFNPMVMKDLANQLKSDHEHILANLYTKIKKIYEHINTQNETGSRMIIEAVLFAAAEIMSDKTKRQNIVIVPEMSIPPISIINPVTGYELCLSGSVDYVVIDHILDVKRNNRERLLDPYVSREDIIEISKNTLFVTQARRTYDLATYVPQAVSQSIAWMNFVEKLGYNPGIIYYCVTNGSEWIFCATQLDSESDQVVYTESTVQRLVIEELQYSDKPLREIVQVVREWIKEFTIDHLYIFDYQKF